MADADLAHAMGTLLLLSIPAPGEGEVGETLSPGKLKACRMILAEADKRGIIGRNTFAIILIDAIEEDATNG